jgi:hypothetical protein
MYRRSLGSNAGHSSGHVLEQRQSLSLILLLGQFGINLLMLQGVARNSSNALLSADSKPYLSGVASDPTFFWFQVATTMK